MIELRTFCRDQSVPGQPIFHEAKSWRRRAEYQGLIVGMADYNSRLAESQGLSLINVTMPEEAWALLDAQVPSLAVLAFLGARGPELYWLDLDTGDTTLMRGVAE